MTLEGLEKTLSLAPEYDEPDDAEKMLAQAWEGIFDQKPFAWCTTENLWPQNLRLAVFEHWFDHKHLDLVEDMVAGPVGDQDYFPEDEDEEDDESETACRGCGGERPDLSG